MTPPTTADGAPLRVELLGSGGYHPSERRHTACVLVPELGLLLDAGTGAFRVLSRVAAGALPADRLDVVVTHGHLDHVVGLTYLLGLACEGRLVETVVHATPPTIEAIETHLLAPSVFPLLPVGRLMELGGTLPLAGGAKLTTFALDHPGGSVGVRVDVRGRSFAYVTDTRPLKPEALAAARGVDLLLHEANFDSAQRQLAADSGHCTAADAALAAVAVGAGRLVLMHLDPRATEANEARALAEARAIRPDAVYGVDGMVIEV